MREVQIIVKFSGDPDFPGLDPTVIRWVVSNIIGIPAAAKVQRNVLKNSGLIVFDGKMIMSVSLLDQVGCDLALGQ